MKVKGLYYGYLDRERTSSFLCRRIAVLPRGENLTSSLVNVYPDRLEGRLREHI